jgi:hypothetical protein
MRDLLARQQLISKQLIQVIAGLAAGGGSRPIPFAKGGPVNGPSHARGGVPAILEGGEYVIPKGYMSGGEILDQKGVGLIHAELMKKTKGEGRAPDRGNITVTSRDVVDYKAGGKSSLERTFGPIAEQIVKEKMGRGAGSPQAVAGVGGGGGRTGFDTTAASQGYSWLAEGLGSATQEKGFKDALNKGIESALNTAGETTATLLGGTFGGAPAPDSSYYDLFDKGFQGTLFEQVVAGFQGVLSESDVAGGNPFDYTTGIGKFSKAYPEAQKLQYLDAKVTRSAGMPFEETFKSKTSGQIREEVFNDIQSAAKRKKGFETDDKAMDEIGRIVAKPKTMQQIKQNADDMRTLGVLLGRSPDQAIKNLGVLRDRTKLRQELPQRRAAGGNIFSRRGTDTVPAMLTPGEFVINKSSAKSIGYGKLGKMNRMARGGIVGGVQHLQEGGAATGGTLNVNVAGGMVEVIGVVDIGGGLDAVVTALNNIETEIGGLAGGTGSVAEKDTGGGGGVQKATATPVEDSAISLEAVGLDVTIVKGGASTQVAKGADSTVKSIDAGTGVLNQILATLESKAEAADPKAAPKAPPLKKKAGATEGPTAADTAEVEALTASLAGVIDEMERFAGIVEELTFPKNLNKDLVSFTKNLKELGKSTASAVSDVSDESPGGAPDTGELTQSASDAAAALQALAEAAVLATEAGVELADSTVETADAMDDVSTSSTEAADSAEELADSNEEAAVSGADIASGLGNAVGAIGGITAAFATLDFTSAEGTISSVIALGFAVQSATAAITTLGPALGGMTGVFGRLTGVTAADTVALAAHENYVAADTAANIASATSEEAEAAANVFAASSEYVETDANAVAALAELQEAALSARAAAADALEARQSAIAAASDSGEALASKTAAAADLLEAAASLKSALAGVGKAAAKGVGAGLSAIGGGVAGIGAKFGLTAGGGGAIAGTTGVLTSISAGITAMLPVITQGFALLTPLLIAAAIGKVIIKPLADAFKNAVFGKEEELAPGVKGRRKASGKPGDPGGAGSLAAVDAAANTLIAIIAGFGVGAVLMTATFAAVTAPMAIFIGLIVAVIGILYGLGQAFVAFQNQLEFNALVELQKSSDKLAKSFDNLSKIDTVSTANLASTNTQVEATIQQAASFIEQSIKSNFTEHLLSAGNLFENVVNKSLPAMIAPFAAIGNIALAAVDASFAGADINRIASGETSVKGALGGELRGGARGDFTGAGDKAVDAISEQLSTIGSEGIFSSLINGVDLFITKLPIIGGFLGELAGSFGRIEENINVGKFLVFGEAIKNAADQISDDDIKKIEEQFARIIDQFTTDLAQLGDMDILNTLAEMQTIDPDVSDIETQAALVDNAFADLSNTLNNVADPLGNFGRELDRFIGNLTQIKFLKDVANQITLLEKANRKGEAGKLAETFVDLNAKLGEAADGAEKISILRDKIAELEGVVRSGTPAQSDAAKAALRSIRAVEQQTVEMVAESAARARATELMRQSTQALDALAAGLELFGGTLTGISSQVQTLAGQIQSEFDMITGEKLIGKLEEFNPFENVAAATDVQIDAGVTQLQGLGGKSDGDVAFKNLGDLAKAQSDLPRIMRDVLNDLKLGREPGETISNQDVRDAIIGKKATDQEAGSGLLGAGIELPPQAMEALVKALEGEAAQGRQGEGLVFSFDQLTNILEKTGKVTELLGQVSEIAAQQLSAAFSALNSFKNSLLDVARVQQKINKFRLESEISVLDKQESIRDRIDKALGKTPNAFKRATADLQKRLEILAKGGVEGGTALAGDVLDPATLFNRLQTLEQKRDAARGKLGLKPGQASLGGGADGAVALTQEMKANSDELAKLNSEINGTEAALKELANDTRLLAAIEGKIHEQKARELASKSTVVSILDGLNKLQKGEITVQDFNKTITGPLDALERATADGGSVSFDEAVDLISRLQGGDKLLAGRIETKARGIAEARGLDPGDAGEIKKIKDELLNNLITSAGIRGVGMAEAGGLPGVGDILRQELANIIDAQTEQETLGTVMERIGNAQIGILEKQTARQNAQLQIVLQTAEVGFLRAAHDFQDAVAEFAAMRGGTSAEEAEQRARVRLTNQQKVTAQARTRVAGAEAENEKMPTQTNQRELDSAIERLKIEEEIERRAVNRLNRAQQLNESQKKQDAVRKKNEKEEQAKKEEEGAEGKGKKDGKEADDGKKKEEARKKESDASRRAKRTVTSNQLKSFKERKAIFQTKTTQQDTDLAALATVLKDEDIAGQGKDLSAAKIVKDSAVIKQINEAFDIGRFGEQEFDQFTPKQTEAQDKLFAELAQGALGEGPEADALAQELKDFRAEIAAKSADSTFGIDFSEIEANMGKDFSDIIVAAMEKRLEGGAGAEEARRGRPAPREQREEAQAKRVDKSTNVEIGLGICCTEITRRLDAIITVLGGELTTSPLDPTAVAQQAMNLDPSAMTPQGGSQFPPGGGIVGPTAQSFLDVFEDIKGQIDGDTTIRGEFDGKDEVNRLRKESQEIFDRVDAAQAAGNQDEATKIALDEGIPATLKLIKAIRESRKKSVGPEEAQKQDPEKKKKLDEVERRARAMTQPKAPQDPQARQAAKTQARAGGILGAIQTSNDILKQILTCLCGGLLPETQALNTKTAEVVKKTEENKKATEDIRT